MQGTKPRTRCRKRFFEALLTAGLAVAWASVAHAQINPLPSERVEIRHFSGLHDNPTDVFRIAFQTEVQADEAAPWLRLYFVDAHLDGESYIRITSTLDGAVQRLWADSLEQWRFASAYFNGSAVEIELVAAPTTTGNFFRLGGMDVGLDPGVPQPRTQCGPVDDRISSDEPSVGRTIPGGCTATIYNAASCNVTAGHCLGINSTYEFNVPESLPGGAIQHPGPEDQYAIDASSEVGAANGIGADWGHFRVFENTETGMLPFEAQQAFTPLANEIPALPVDIRIYGYGVDGGSANQTQQLSLGPVLALTGSVSHRADTTGGSSGSSIVDLATGRTIGIHTHGGCDNDPDSFNSGTLITIAGLQAEVRTCVGIEFDYPNGLPELIDTISGTVLLVNITATDDPPDPETVTLRVSVDGGPFSGAAMTHLGGGLYEAVIPPSPCGSIVDYYISLQTLNGIPVTDPPGAPAETYGALSGAAVVIVVQEDFESPKGYTATGDATTGHWEVGVPVNCDRGDPPADADGSGQCFLTENSAAGACNSDVDDGSVILTSPVWDLSGDGILFLRYWRWYSNNFGNAPEADIFVVDISNDAGATWTNLETVGPAGPDVIGGWLHAAFNVAGVIEPTDRMQVRFAASDLGEGSVVEAAIDDLSAVLLQCVDNIPPAIAHDDGATTDPFTGYIDPRQESTDGKTLDLGIDTVTIRFTEQVQAIGGGPLTAQSFSVTGTGPSHPTVTNVHALANPRIVLTLSDVIPVQEWTTIIADVEDLVGNPIEHGGDQGPEVDEPDRVDIGFLPADVDQSGSVQPFDLLRFRQIVNDLFDPPQGDDFDFVDINRNYGVDPFDLLIIRNLIQGTGVATRPWAGETLPIRP